MFDGSLNSYCFVPVFFQRFATCTLCVHFSSFQEILLPGSSLKNGEYHAQKMCSLCMCEYFYPFQSSLHANESEHRRFFFKIRYFSIYFPLGLFLCACAFWIYLWQRTRQLQRLEVCWPFLGEHLWYTCSGRLSLSWHTQQKKLPTSNIFLLLAELRWISSYFNRSYVMDQLWLYYRWIDYYLELTKNDYLLFDRLIFFNRKWNEPAPSSAGAIVTIISSYCAQYFRVFMAYMWWKIQWCLSIWINLNEHRETRGRRRGTVVNLDSELVCRNVRFT